MSEKANHCTEMLKHKLFLIISPITACAFFLFPDLNEIKADIWVSRKNNSTVDFSFIWYPPLIPGVADETKQVERKNVYVKHRIPYVNTINEPLKVNSRPNYRVISN